VRTSVRDSTYVLDGILDNQTALPMEKHFRARCCATAASHRKAGAIGTRATAAQRTPVACGLTMAGEQQTFEEEGDRVASCASLR